MCIFVKIVIVIVSPLFIATARFGDFATSYQGRTFLFSVKESRQMIDRTNTRYGRLVCLEYKGKSKWLCKCDCGNTKIVPGLSLVNGHARSCGCLHSETITKRNTTHGLRSAPEYTVWAGMVERCTNPNAINFSIYGGRGITVCLRWKNSFQNFYEDMGQRPSPLYSIERINNNDGYNPFNCRWATKAEQSRNKRNNRMLTLGDTTMTMSEWCRYLGITISTLSYRLKKFGTEIALSAPKMKPGEKI